MSIVIVSNTVRIFPLERGILIRSNHYRYSSRLLAVRAVRV